MKMHTFVVAIVGIAVEMNSSAAYGQAEQPAAAPQPAPGTPVMVQMPDGTYKQGYAVPVATAQEPKPEPKAFALSANPLNFIIGRYGLNVEYQPTLHHGLIVSPHFDYVNADVTGGYDANGQAVRYKESFSGFGAEVGYRFYTGDKGFNGFFVSPSLLLATYKSSGDFLGSNISTSFNSIGFAWEVGGQAQIGGGFLIGGGGGLQYTKVSKDFTDMPFSAAVIAGGGWRPRIILNIGYAF